MGESCSLFAHVRNPKGEVVESKLFNDLKTYTSDRKEAVRLYKIGTNQEFLDAAGDQAKFDENGEITFSSLRKLTTIRSKKEEVLFGILEKEAKVGIYDYEEAEMHLQNFNRNSPYNDKYMATITLMDNGKYQLSLVEKNDANIALLERTVQTRELRDRIIFYLHSKGVAVEETSDTLFRGRYSTKEVEAMANGMYALIKLAHGGQLNSTLAEEAGHFAIASMGNHPLVKRLLKTLTPDAAAAIIKENKKEGFDTGVNTRRELAGQLVGRAIMDEVDKQSALGRLASKIVDAAKTIYYKFRGNEAEVAKIEAERIARQIARGFMSLEEQGSVEEALKRQETLYNKTENLHEKLLKEMSDSLITLREQLKQLQATKMLSQLDFAITELLNTSVSAAEIANGKAAQALILSQIVTAIQPILTALSQEGHIMELINSTLFGNTQEFLDHLGSSGKALREARLFLRSSTAIGKLLIDYCNAFGTNFIVEIDGNNVDLTQLATTLITANSLATSCLERHEKQHYIKFLETVLGEKSITIAAHKVWRLGLKNRGESFLGKLFNWEITKKPGKGLIISQAEMEVTMEDAVEYLKDDIGFFSRWLKAMSNNPDIVGQVADVATKMAKTKADRVTAENWNTLQTLKKELEDLGLSSSYFYEKDEEQVPTGYILSDVKWGAYIKDQKEFKKKCQEEFIKKHPNLQTKPYFIQKQVWAVYFSEKMFQWHKDHSKYVLYKGRPRRAPNKYYIDENGNHKYDNTAEYRRLIASKPEVLKWYNKYRALKDQLDSTLMRGATISERLPQFKGSLTNMVQNRLDKKEGALHAWRSKVQDLFCESSEDTDYGNELTYNSEEEDLFDSPLIQELSKIHRLPLYGINELQDMSTLSTDIFYSTLLYASMINSYGALKDVVDTLEIGKSVLKQRKVHGITTEEVSETESKAFSRYTHFLDRQVYGIGQDKIVIGQVVVNKLVNMLTRAAAFNFLNGNPYGGAKNTLTGFLEIFKEAFSGDYYNIADFVKANETYWKYLPENWWETGNVTKKNKLSLFYQYFNVRQDSQGRFRDWHTRTGAKISRIFGEVLSAPYSMGDHYMQGIAYIAIAQSTFVYDEDGNKHSLWDIYQVADIIDDNGKKAGKELKITGTYYKNSNRVLLQGIIDKIKDALETGNLNIQFLTDIFSEDEIAYMKNNPHKYDLNNIAYYLSGSCQVAEETQWYLKDVIGELQYDIENTKWGEKDEVAYINKCREINDRLHGIYNRYDRTELQSNIFAAAWFSMKTFLLGMLERRLSEAHYSVVLGGMAEGSWNSVAKVLLNSNKELNLFWKAAAIALPFNKAVQNKLKEAGFGAFQISNLNRNFADITVIALINIVKGLIMSLGGGDDDSWLEHSIRSAVPFLKDKEGMKNLKKLEGDSTGGLVLANIYYLLNGLQYEQLTPHQLINEFERSNFMPVGYQTMKDYAEFLYLWAGATIVDDKSNSTFYWQQNKKGIYEKGDPKYEKSLRTIIPYADVIPRHSAPAESAESFDYYQNLRR